MSSIRRLVGDNKVQGASSAASERSGRLMLSPQLRVSESGVLRLEPTDAVQLPDDPGSPSDDEVVGDGASSPEGQRVAPSFPEEAVSGDKASGPDTAGHPETPQRAVDALTAKIAELETAIAKTSDQWEPDGISKDDYAGTESAGMAWPETADLDATGAPVRDEHETDAADAAPAEIQDEKGPGDDQVLDEEALRELVADIVRSELQGPLGERITRNVRKLVRREIHRALAARDLD
ncbi:hypothetical protein [Roseobacter sp. MH60115]|uniref:hypothetical protein n=1 Tax=Roseobacter sp. MH60115 TaxID=2785324 RepID=UPI001E42F007|nr:hypothetical protein [Roseobacter sp. MH60115]